MVNVEHLPERPTWECRECKLPWPCPPSKMALSIEFAEYPATLALYLGGQLVDALRDLQDVDGQLHGDLFRRFMLWRP